MRRHLVSVESKGVSSVVLVFILFCTMFIAASAQQVQASTDESEEAAPVYINARSQN
jgi:hypothetical protein